MAKISAEERFWRKVEKTDNCWVWSGGLDTHGYGQFFNANKKIVLAHRAAYEMLVGPIPPGEGFHGTCVCHHCDNRKCVRPDHLFLGSNADNMKDRDRKGRTDRTKKAKGSATGPAKLKEADAEKIWKLRHAGTPLKTIAKQFNVSESQVSRIYRGVSWQHMCFGTKDA